MAIDETRVRALLAGIALPNGADLIAAEAVSAVEIDGGEVTVVLQLTDVARDARHALEDRIVSTLEAEDGVDEVLVETEVDDLDLPAPSAPDAGVSVHGAGGGAGSVKPAKTALADVKHIVAIASGKGGVGKSTVAVNTALALAKRGARVGVCDIDIYGPSVPTLLGVAQGKPGVTADQKRFLPVEAYGLKVMSIGFLVDDDTPVIWRGPIVSSVVKQFLDDVQWGELDYLVIDLPPGTGDAQLTLSQSAPITGVIIVTTPSELALIDAIKGLQMFRKVDTPILGIVENMSHYTCSECGHDSLPFNGGGTSRVAEQFGAGIIASVPLSDAVQRGGDAGTPIMATDPDGPQGEAFFEIADGIIGKLPFDKAPDEGKKKGLLASLFKR